MNSKGDKGLAQGPKIGLAQGPNFYMHNLPINSPMPKPLSHHCPIL